MKPLYLSIALAFSWWLTLAQEEISISSKSLKFSDSTDTTVVKKIVTPGFNVLIQRTEDGDDIYTIVRTTNGVGVKLDQKAFIETKSRLDSGCHRHQEYGEYLFKSNLKFKFTLRVIDVWCGLERGEEEDEVKYLERLLMIDDPYQIPSRELNQVSVQHYIIDDLGTINADGESDDVVNDRLAFLDRFDRLPKDRLVLLRNTIFAKKGYAFKTPELQDYFSKKPWYVPKYDNIVKFLSASDKKLIAYLEKLENR